MYFGALVENDGVWFVSPEEVSVFLPNDMDETSREKAADSFFSSNQLLAGGNCILASFDGVTTDASLSWTSYIKKKAGSVKIFNTDIYRLKLACNFSFISSEVFCLILNDDRLSFVKMTEYKTTYLKSSIFMPQIWAKNKNGLRGDEKQSSGDKQLENYKTTLACRYIIDQVESACSELSQKEKALMGTQGIVLFSNDLTLDTGAIQRIEKAIKYPLIKYCMENKTFLKSLPNLLLDKKRMEYIKNHSHNI